MNSNQKTRAFLDSLSISYSALVEVSLTSDEGHAGPSMSMFTFLSEENPLEVLKKIRQAPAAIFEDSRLSPVFLGNDDSLAIHMETLALAQEEGLNPASYIEEADRLDEAYLKNWQAARLEETVFIEGEQTAADEDAIRLNKAMELEAGAGCAGYIGLVQAQTEELCAALHWGGGQFPSPALMTAYLRRWRTRHQACLIALEPERLLFSLEKPCEEEQCYSLAAEHLAVFPDLLSGQNRQANTLQSYAALLKHMNHWSLG
ncbi:MAG: DUF4253 domain-containing protein [Candidatus Obscuribacterales bacterium]|nr:DUF4253 domain-containing protein [Candidatus Obscuribacterales bacterium]